MTKYKYLFLYSYLVNLLRRVNVVIWEQAYQQSLTINLNKMKEFMLYIKNSGDAKAALSPDDHLAFVKKCEVYIGELRSQGKLVAAQPIMREGVVLSRSANNWAKAAIDPAQEVQVGYYHIMAETMDEAIDIARQNPEFEYVPSARIEIHQIKTREEKTDFVYPKQ